jgi:hypothetical protein
MVLDRLSVVDKGANKRAFAVLKRDGSEDSPDSDPMSGTLELADTTPAGVGGFLRRVADRLAGEAVDKAADSFPFKNEGGEMYPASDYAYVPDPQKPTTWKLRLTSKPGGEPDAKIVGDAVAALGAGFRGNKVAIPTADLAGVKATVRAAWKKANPDAKAADIPAAIAKAVTFASIIAGRELQDALPDAFDTLEDSVWSAIYARDAAGVDLAPADKQALIAQDLDEFKTYLLGIIDAGVQVGKGDITEGALGAARIQAIVAKVGRKISAARLEQLKTAATALSAVLAEAEADKATETDAAAEEDADAQKAKKRAAPEETDVTNEEFTAAMAPFAAQLAAIEKRLPEPKVTETDGTHAAEDDGADDALTLEGVAEAVGKLADRFDAIEKAANRGQRTSGDGQESGNGQVKKSVLAGILR